MVVYSPTGYAQQLATREYLRERMRNEGAFRAFQAMAPVYDVFTAGEDHQGWLAGLLHCLDRYGPAGNRLLDVACGTGKSLIPTVARQWRVTGYDISPRMLDLARRKVGTEVTLQVADMRKQPHLGYFDVVWAVNDVLNYLLDPWWLTKVLTGMRQSLAIGGLLAFDLNTLLFYRTVYAKGRIVRTGGPALLWTGFARTNESPGCECVALFEVEGRGTDFSMAHRQLHFPEATARNCIAEAGLECLEVFGRAEDGTLVQPLDEARHRKAVYLARDRESSLGRFGAKAQGPP